MHYVSIVLEQWSSNSNLLSSYGKQNALKFTKQGLSPRKYVSRSRKFVSLRESGFLARESEFLARESGFLARESGFLDEKVGFLKIKWVFPLKSGVFSEKVGVVRRNLLFWRKTPFLDMETRLSRSREWVSQWESGFYNRSKRFLGFMCNSLATSYGVALFQPFIHPFLG